MSKLSIAGIFRRRNLLYLVASPIFAAGVLLSSCHEPRTLEPIVAPEPYDQLFLTYIQLTNYDSSATTTFLTYEPEIEMIDSFHIPLRSVSSFTVSPDGRRLFVAGDGVTIEYDVESQLVKASYPYVAEIAESRSGRFRAICTPQQAVVLDATAGDTLFNSGASYRSPRFLPSDSVLFLLGPSSTDSLTITRITLPAMNQTVRRFARRVATELYVHPNEAFLVTLSPAEIALIPWRDTGEIRSVRAGRHGSNVDLDPVGSVMSFSQRSSDGAISDWEPDPEFFVAPVPSIAPVDAVSTARMRIVFPESPNWFRDSTLFHVEDVAISVDQLYVIGVSRFPAIVKYPIGQDRPAAYHQLVEQTSELIVAAKSR